ncbi:conserved protein of unknown function [Cupriavidus taiwanensis]|uniref:Uncharacterized protein n=1 Tax=Cupriavidus taiwanensis TaxID=164546 RepID=A0A9Q7XTB0_9BURK|nr:conserved protein of unknown function [Cupriavidus taiwanensis]
MPSAWRWRRSRASCAHCARPASITSPPVGAASCRTCSRQRRGRAVSAMPPTGDDPEPDAVLRWLLRLRTSTVHEPRGSKAGEPPLPGSPLQQAIRCRLSFSAMTMTDRLTPMPDAPVRPLRTGRARASAVALAPSLPQRTKRAISPRRIGAPPDSARFPA